MSENYLFITSDPRGYSITLSENRYQEHIIQGSGHTEVPYQDIMKAVKQPAFIYESSSYEDRDVYFAKSSSVFPELYVKVPVKIDEESKTGDVVTAMVSSKIDGVKEGGAETR